jgi:uncharacterized membrane protein YkoI
MTLRALSLPIAAVGLALFAAGPALAHNDATPLHRCVDAALAKKPGKVLEVELEREKGREIYEIEIAGADGKRWELECDLETISIIKVELDDDDDKSGSKSR